MKKLLRAKEVEKRPPPVPTVIVKRAPPRGRPSYSQTRLYARWCSRVRRLKAKADAGDPKVLRSAIKMMAEIYDLVDIVASDRAWTEGGIRSIVQPQALRFRVLLDAWLSEQDPHHTA